MLTARTGFEQEQQHKGYSCFERRRGDDRSEHHIYESQGLRPGVFDTAFELYNRTRCGALNRLIESKD